jgi:hypothetical protein
MVFLFAFIGISNTLHTLENQETHFHHSGEHLCPVDAHHYCALCDTIVLPGIVVDQEPVTIPVLYMGNQTLCLVGAPLPSGFKNHYGRAPPRTA